MSNDTLVVKVSTPDRKQFEKALKRIKKDWKGQFDGNSKTWTLTVRNSAEMEWIQNGDYEGITVVK